MTSGSTHGAAPPTVSVLMAVYNGQRYVRQAIDGILAQSFRDFEFVIVDDGSTDSTPLILDEYVDARIVRLRHAVNRGLIAALTTGLDAARGEFVARQDADDISNPERLRIQVEFLRLGPDVTVVGSDSIFESEEGGVPTTRTVERDPLRIAWILLFYCPLTHSSIMFRREVIKQLGGYGDGDLFVEDFALWARVTRSSKVASTGHALVIRRRPPESITEMHGSEMSRAARRVSLQNLQWVSGASVATDQLDALQAFCGNRSLSLEDVLGFETAGTRDLPVTVGRVFDQFWAKLGTVPAEMPEFRRWAFRWVGSALLRRSRSLLAESALRTKPEKRLGLRVARSVALSAIRVSPAVVWSRRGATAAARAIVGRA